MPSFTEKLHLAQRSSNSILCVGLDPDPKRLPEHLAKLGPDAGVIRFCKEIIDATADVCCAYKPN
ncbi:MAG: orotidine-5'-phosphate decarboxylase, partial [Rhodothermales bacterium]